MASLGLKEVEVAFFLEMQGNLQHSTAQVFGARLLVSTVVPVIFRWTWIEKVRQHRRELVVDEHAAEK